MGQYRVWEWSIEIGLGSHGQRKMSSSFLPETFDSREDALAWARAQTEETKENWGIWDVSQCGRSIVLECEFQDLPKSYREAFSSPYRVC